MNEKTSFFPFAAPLMGKRMSERHEREDADGRDNYSAADLEEIGELKRRELALRQSEERFRAVFDHTAEGIIIMDAVGRIETVNRATNAMFEFEPDELIGQDVTILMRQEDRDHDGHLSRSELRTILRLGQFHDLKGRRKNGSIFPIEISLSMFEIDGQKKFVSIVRDVTQDRYDKEALQQSEERFRRSFEDAQIGVVIVGLDGAIQQANAAFGKMLGYSQGELVGVRPNKDLTHPDDVEKSERLRMEALAGHRNSVAEEKRYIHKDGSTVWASANYSFIRDAQGNHLHSLGHIEDISERKTSEQALAQSEQRFRRSFEHAGVGMSVSTLDGHFTEVNRALCQMLGYTEAELLSMSFTDILHPDEVEQSLKERRQAISSQYRETPIERKYRHKDGHLVWGILNRAVISDADGEPICIISQVQDISKRKQAEDEKARLEGEMRQNQKLEAIGQLAAGIAHEINTPTQYVGDNLQFIKDAFADIAAVLQAYGKLATAANQNRELASELDAVAKAVDKADLDYLLEEVPTATDQSLGGVEQIARIVLAMKEFSHPGHKDKSAADLNHAIENTMMVCRNEWKHIAEIETDFDPRLPLVACLVDELNQVFLNIIVNAAHAIESAGRDGDGKIKIVTKQDGDWVEIRISDNGTGIPDDIRDRIFDPFFTTKEVGKGTGQGLAVSYDVVVNKHKGRIAIETAVGEGTTFVIRLPADASLSESEAA